jgi:hypothetical protein
MWHVEPLQDGDREVGDCTAARKQQQTNGVFCAVRQATIEQEQRNGVFCAFHAEVL